MYASADFIVRACNAHSPLVAALCRLEAAVKKFMAEEGYLDRQISNALQDADAALAKANGTSPQKGGL
jgi:hypothetical protein